MQLKTGELPLLSTIIQQLAGVHLDDTKGYLIESRLGPIAQRSGCANFNELYFKLRYEADTSLKQEVIDAITTHETNWFRDGAPFDAFQFKLAPESFDARDRLGTPRKLRVWSAACSTGQEPYGLAMVLADMIPDIEKWDVQILGTDISKSSLAAAEKGVYSLNDVGRTQRPQAMQKWFDQTPDGAKVKPLIRRMVTFRHMNLMEPFPAIGPFDIVFIRNVLIYFEKPAKAQILQRIRASMMPHGYMVLGSTENLVEGGEGWDMQTHCRAVVYQPSRPGKA